MFDCKNLKMHFIVFSAIVLHFTIHQVNCRSVHLDIDALSRSEVKEGKDLNHESGISGRLSWKRLKPLLHRELQRIRNVKGTNANKINQDSTETTVSIQLKKNDNFSNASLNADKNKDIYSKNDTGITNTTFIMSKLTSNSSHNEETIDKSDVEEEFASNMTHDEIPEVNQYTTASNFLDIAVSGILHETELSNATFAKFELTNNSGQNEETDESDVEEAFASNMPHDEMPSLDQHTITSNFSNTDILYQTKLPNATFAKSELTNNSSQNEESIDESDVEEAFASNMPHDEMPSLDQHTITSNFPDTSASDILHQIGMTNISFIKSELINNSSRYEEIAYESDGKEEAYESDVEKDFVSDMTHAETPHLDYSLTSDLPDNIISNILNQTADSMLFQALNDNGSSIDSFEFDETSVLSQGGHIATLQEVSTMGFELLIDSETKKNLLLMELLTSQSDLIDDFTDDDDSDFTTLEFNHINEREEDETISNGEVNFSDVTSLNTDGFDFTTLKLSHINQSEEYKNTTDSTILNTDENDSDFTTLKLNYSNETEKEETASNEEITVFNNNVSQTENSEFSTHEVKTIENELELSDSVQNGNGTEWTNTESEHPMCPDPGWCVFWFLGLEDTCAKDSHCHGSLICCKIGCTKTCIDADR